MAVNIYEWTKWIDLEKSKPNNIVFLENTPANIIKQYELFKKEDEEKKKKNLR